MEWKKLADGYHILFTDQERGTRPIIASVLEYEGGWSVYITGDDPYAVGINTLQSAKQIAEKLATRR